MNELWLQSLKGHLSAMASYLRKNGSSPSPFSMTEVRGRIMGLRGEMQKRDEEGPLKGIIGVPVWD